ncbi:acyltransferase family protein [Rhodopila globiformis]|nr:acyltransferase [Rhodopila globiformis]
MPDDIGALSRLFTWFVDSPLMVVVLFAVAIATATLLLRRLPPIRRVLAAVESGRHTSIDGLRGFLGIGVFIHHTVITWFYLHGHGWTLPPSRLVVHLGQTSVALFFMITAFLFWSRVLSRGSGLNWAEFFISRLCRLYPAYLVMLALLVAVAWGFASQQQQANGNFWPSLASWLVFTMFGTLNLNGLPDTGEAVAWVTWSLPYEWLFYLVLPALAFVAGRARKPVAAAASAAAVIALFLSFYWFGVLDPFNPKILLSFLGGIAAAHWVRNQALKDIGNRRSAGYVAIAALLTVVLFMPTAYAWKSTLGLTVFFVVIASGHDLWGLLRRPGLLWLGDISYSIYLLHGALLWTVFRHVLPHTLASSAPVYIGVSLVNAIVLVLVASIVFLAVERPAILAGKRWQQRLGRSAVPVGASP